METARLTLAARSSLVSPSGSECVLALGPHGDPRGLLLIRPKEWDTAQLRIRIGEITLLVASEGFAARRAATSGLLIAAESSWVSSAFSYLITRVECGDLGGIHALEEQGFRLLSEMVTLVSNGASIEDTDPGGQAAITAYEPEDLPALVEIAHNAFRHSRFHMEPAFDKTDSNRLHGEWISNCCENGLADVVLVAREGSRIIGFNALRLDRPFDGEDAVGVIVLIAVSAPARRKGVGRQLVREGMRWFAGKTNSVLVRTELANYGAIQMYMKEGFRMAYGSIYYRRMLDHV